MKYTSLDKMSSTLYIQNLNERVPLKSLTHGLRELVNSLDIPVMEIYAKKRLEMRGQAFVVCPTVDDAMRGLKLLQGYRIFGKSMVVKISRRKSHVIAKKDGTLEMELRLREMDRLEKANRPPRLTRRQQMMMAHAQSGAPSTPSMPAIPKMPGQMPQVVSSGEVQLPNKILFVEHIPSTATEADVSGLFSSYAGFVEVRLVPTRPGLAFVEFEDETRSSIARQALDGHLMASASGSSDGVKISVSFARK